MPHSSTSIWIHASWTTWEKSPMITPGIKDRIYKYIFQEFISCGCIAKIINGPANEVHCLFLLNPKKSTDEIVKMVKGATSHRINQEDLTPGKFAWQKGYNAASVSESQLEKMIGKINNMK